MEYVKLFEQFINESNELLTAQTSCKVAMFKCEKLVKKTLNSLKKLGHVKTFTTKIVPYNYGYQLNIKLRNNRVRRNGGLTPYREIDILDQEIGIYSIFLMPAIFFEKIFDTDYDGITYMEGNLLNIPLDGDILPSHEEKNPKFKIKYKKDIVPAKKEFISMFTKQMENLERLVSSTESFYDFS